MKYRDVVKKSIVAFMDGRVPENTASLKEGGLKYTPEYFDDLEKEILGETESKEKEDNDAES